MKTNEFENIIFNLKQEYAIFKLIKPLDWANAQTGDYFIKGDTWCILIRKNGSYDQSDIPPSYLKFIDTTLVHNSYNMNDIIEQIKKQHTFIW